MTGHVEVRVAAALLRCARWRVRVNGTAVAADQSAEVTAGRVVVALEAEAVVGGTWAEGTLTFEAHVESGQRLRLDVPSGRAVGSLLDLLGVAASSRAEVLPKSQL